MNTGSQSLRDPAAGAQFPTTHWTLVMRVREGESERQAALDELCHLYWFPIYAFVRRRGHAQHDAEDLTQGIFEKILHDRTLEAAESSRGRLRTLLLASAERHLADQHRRKSAVKRGGGQQFIAFDELKAEERYAIEPQDHRDPEHHFVRAWIQLLLAGVREKLRLTFEESGRTGVFEALLPFLLMDGEPPSYREVSRILDSSETAVRLLVFRLRSRFRELLRQEVAKTVESPEAVEEEMQWLRATLASS
jgi:RNA polymerase sigma-70 factor (ECF subfamily)